MRTLALLLLAGCAYPLAPLPPAARPLPWLERVDWPAAGQELAEVLAGYLRVDTSNPPGNETAGARYLADLLAREGISAELVGADPARRSLIARLAGDGGAPPLCLLSHLDVVPADPAEWPADKGPFSGAIDADGYVWGRGALDMKGMGAVELMTLIWLERLGVPLERDVILIAVADEEVHNTGMREVVAERWAELGCATLVNEGGIGLTGALFPDETAIVISTAEKGVLWLRLTARAAGGHGSTPRDDHAPAVLLGALERLRAREPSVSIPPTMRELLARAGAAHGGLAGFVMRRPTLTDWFVEGRLLAQPATRAAITNTVTISGLSTGEHAPNVVPNEAHALLDCRLQPGVTDQMMIAELRALLGEDPRLVLEVLHYASATESPRDDPFFNALARHALASHPGATFGPALSVGFTDSKFARDQGTRAYGLVPFVVPLAELATMHAPHERVSVENLRRGLRTLLGAVLEVSAGAARQSP